MSGLGDAHTHFTWNGGDLMRLGELGVEEHTLLTMRSAQCYLDSGYTMFVSYVCPNYSTASLSLTCLIEGALVRPQRRRDWTR